MKPLLESFPSTRALTPSRGLRRGSHRGLEQRSVLVLRKLGSIAIRYISLQSSFSSTEPFFLLRIPRPDIRIIQQKTHCYLSPVIFAHEHAAEQERGYLSRQQHADRHGVSLDRVIQWLALLNLSAIQQEEIISLGDY